MDSLVCFTLISDIMFSAKTNFSSAACNRAATFSSRALYCSLSASRFSTNMSAAAFASAARACASAAAFASAAALTASSSFGFALRFLISAAFSSTAFCAGSSASRRGSFSASAAAFAPASFAEALASNSFAAAPCLLLSFSDRMNTCFTFFVKRLVLKRKRLCRGELLAGLSWCTVCGASSTSSSRKTEDGSHTLTLIGLWNWTCDVLSDGSIHTTFPS
mmetsp:Transcript_64087/g.113710  ORF Transcript_64087/g.113710 Transcript_64087/m.113710 type:complete len:220 (+) Transcript_64087:1427-2086(+)